MRTSTSTKRQREQRDSSRRKHVRPLDVSASSERASRRRSGRVQPQRMVPRSQAEVGGSVSVARRRAERRARKARAQAHQPRPRSRRANPATYLLSWRLVSGMIVAGLSVVLYMFLTMGAFYVDEVAIGGEKYMSPEEIFRFSDVAQRHIFWVDAADVEARLESVPNIADASVYVGWPPDMVQIIVTEREPALVWEQSVRVWVDLNGIVMKQREDRTNLLRIVVPNAEEPITVGERIPPTIIQGALYLRGRHPNIDVLLYDSLKGLGYHDGRGWTVWFGTGEDMATKLLTYNALVAEIIDEVQPGEIVMADPDRPYYTVLWRKSG